MSEVSDLLEKYQAFVERLTKEGHEVTVGDVKSNNSLSTSFRGLSDNDDLPIRTLQKLQKLQTKASEIISKAYSED